MVEDTQKNTNQDGSAQGASPSPAGSPERRSIYLISITLERDRHLEAQRRAEDSWSRLTQKQSGYGRDLMMLAAYHEDLAILIHEKIRDFKDSLSVAKPAEPCEAEHLSPSHPSPSSEERQ